MHGAQQTIQSRALTSAAKRRFSDGFLDRRCAWPGRDCRGQLGSWPATDDRGPATVFLRAVAVDDFYTVSGLAQVLARVFGDHHAAVPTAGAAEADGQVALPFLYIVRQQIDQEVRDAGDEFLRLGERADEPGDARVAAGQGAELGNEMRVGQEADVKDQIGVFGHTVLETEADAGDQDVFVGRLFLEAFGQVRPQFMDVELGGVDDPVSNGANRLEALALGSQR